MAGIIQPIPDNGAGAPETLPWATSGTVLEPIPAQEATGWQAYGIGPAPDYRLENYFRNMVRRWIERLQQSALLVEYSSATATVAGFVDPPLAGWTYNVTIDGNLVVTTVTTELTKPEVCVSIAAALNADPVVSELIIAEQVTNFVGIRARRAGAAGAFTCVLGGVFGGTFTLIGPTVPILRTDLDEIGDDFAIGSPTVDSAAAAQDERLTWRKALGAFRAGRDSIAAWSLANTGDASAAFGDNCEASGIGSLAAGVASQATGDTSFARGSGCIASGIDSHASGDVAQATAARAFAHGNGAIASAADAVAVGAGALANTVNAIAMGSNAQAGAADAVAIGGDTQAVGAGSVAIGGSVGGPVTLANFAGDVAIGRGAVTDNGSLAIGEGADAQADVSTACGPGSLASDVGAAAIGNGAIASGQAALAGPNGTASGDGAVAVGATASGDSSVAIGLGSQATANGAVAIGKRNGINGDVNATAAGAVAFGAPQTDSSMFDVAASGINSFAHGDSATASADLARATGQGAVAANRGEEAHASLGIGVAGFTHEAERHQVGRLVAQARTTDATETTLCPGVLDGTQTTWTPKDDRAYRVRVTVVAKEETAAQAKSWVEEFVLSKDAGAFAINGYAFGANMAVVGTIGATLAAAVAQVEDSGGGAINVRGTGIAATDVRWTCRIEYDQVGIDY